MSKIEVFDPTGTIDVQQPHAARIPTLSGKRIGFLTNEQWQAYFALPILKSQIEADFPDSQVLPIDAFPKGNEKIGAADIVNLIKQQNVDAVIIGNAA